MTAAPEEPARAHLTCGEVRTCLLPSLQTLDGRAAAQLLRLRGDVPVRFSERPTMYVLSPEVLTGVDCRLPTSNGSKVRVVGTVAARVALTEDACSSRRRTSASRPPAPSYDAPGGSTWSGRAWSSPSASCPNRPRQRVCCAVPSGANSTSG